MIVVVSQLSMFTTAEGIYFFCRRPQDDVIGPASNLCYSFVVGYFDEFEGTGPALEDLGILDDVLFAGHGYSFGDLFGFFGCFSGGLVGYFKGVFGDVVSIYSAVGWRLDHHHVLVRA